MAEQVFKAVVNDTDPSSGGKSYAVDISGSNYNHFLGKKIGDSVDGIFVGDGEVTLGGFKLEITGGSDLTGTPMRADLDGGGRKKILVSPSTGFKGHKIVKKKGPLSLHLRWSTKATCFPWRTSSPQTHAKSTSRLSRVVTNHLQTFSPPAAMAMLEKVTGRSE